MGERPSQFPRHDGVVGLRRKIGGFRVHDEKVDGETVVGGDAFCFSDHVRRQIDAGQAVSSFCQ